MHVLTLLFILPLSLSTLVSAHPPPREAQYVTLPPLREQAALVDRWTQARIGNIPNILKKYNVDAWLMTQKEYSEDTVFWSLKSFEQFSARRRTVDLFVSAPLNSSVSNQTKYSWIDNTPAVWDELEEVLEAHDPKSIVVNWDQDFAFASGLHVGELRGMEEHLGSKWIERFVGERMVGGGFVGGLTGWGDGGEWQEKLGWYKGLMETSWKMIGEAFSERVIEPEVTSTEVSVCFAVFFMSVC